MDHTHHTRSEDHAAHDTHEQDQAGYGFDRGAAVPDDRRHHDGHAARAGYGSQVDRVPHTVGRAEPDIADEVADPPHPAHDRDVEASYNDDGYGGEDSRCRTPGRTN
jgi:hypothetical protein